MKFTFSITTGLQKNKEIESTPEFKAVMAADTYFKPHSISIADLKNVVRESNYSFIHWQKNYRNAANFDLATGISLDIDDGLSIEDALAKLKTLNCYALLVTTQSHRKLKKNASGIEVEADRYRILVPTIRKFHTYTDLRIATEALAKLLDNSVDTKAMLASQFFIPSPDDAIIHELTGNSLYDPDKELRANVFMSKDLSKPSHRNVQNAWRVDSLIGLLDANKVQLQEVPKVKTVIYCPFCDDINSQSPSAFIPAPTEKDLKRSINCSHCDKTYYSEIPVLSDDEFISRISYKASEIGDETEPAQWIVRDVLAQSECFGLFGDPGGGKSYAMLQLAISVAEPSVKEWLGFPIDRHGPVLYILNDGSHRSLKNRIRRLSGFLKVSKPEELYVLHNQGTYKTWVKDVERFISIKKPILVVLDSLSLAQDSGDENSSSDQKEFANILKNWSLEYTLNVSVIHHTNKSALEKPMHLNNFRGSGFWAGILSSMIEFRKAKTHKHNVFKLVKSRDGAPEATNIREIEYVEHVPTTIPGTYSFKQDEAVSGYKYIGPVSEEKKTRQATDSLVDLTQIMKVGQTFSYKKLIEEIQMSTEKSRSSAVRAINELVKCGYLEKEKIDGVAQFTYLRAHGK